MNIHGGRMTITLRYKNITLFILLGVKASVMWEKQMDGRKRIRTAISTSNFFSWPYHAVLSSRPHLALLLLNRREFDWKPTVGCSVDCSLNRALSHSLAHSWLAKSLLAASWDWQESLLPSIGNSKTETHTACISCGHLYIFYRTDTFPFNHVTAMAYFHRCVLWKESQIDGSVKDLHATVQGKNKRKNRKVLGPCLSTKRYCQCRWYRF